MEYTNKKATSEFTVVQKYDSNFRHILKFHHCVASTCSHGDTKTLSGICSDVFVYTKADKVYESCSVKGTAPWDTNRVDRWSYCAVKKVVSLWWISTSLISSFPVCDFLYFDKMTECMNEYCSPLTNHYIHEKWRLYTRISSKNGKPSTELNTTTQKV